MKVVLFCGGLGMRIREASESVPKPMVHVGDRPILWHVMKYYAHFGHKDFILCLGYRADVIKNYFVNYNEFMSNDFVLSKGGKDVRVFNSDIDDWTVTFVDTGANSNIGQRLKAVERYLDGEEVFLANYSDNLTDFQLPKLIDRFHEQNKTAAFLCVRPNLSCHYVSMGDRGLVEEIKTMDQSEHSHQWRILRVQALHLRLYERRRRTGAGALPPADRREKTWWDTSTTAFGRAWTRSKKNRSWTICTAREMPPGNLVEAAR